MTVTEEKKTEIVEEKELVKKEITLAKEFQFNVQDFQILYEILKDANIKGSEAEIIATLKIKIQKNAEFIQIKQQ